MISDIKGFLWLLKLGALVNFYFFYQTLFPPLVFIEREVLVSAQILFIVSGFRCFFPNSYRNNIVLHNSLISSVFLTRFLATFSEIGLVYLFAYLVRLLNYHQVIWINILSWLMVFQVIASQGFVWGAILTKRIKFYFYEELGWALIYTFNAFSSTYLYFTIDDFHGREILIKLGIWFGLIYLPWQFFHLRSIWLSQIKGNVEKNINLVMIIDGLKESVHNRNQTTQYDKWGGFIGITWMTGYWVALIPVWVYIIIQRV